MLWHNSICLHLRIYESLVLLFVRCFFFLLLFYDHTWVKKENMKRRGYAYWRFFFIGRHERTKTVRACWSYKLVSCHAIFFFFLYFISLHVEIYNSKIMSICLILKIRQIFWFFSFWFLLYTCIKNNFIYHCNWDRSIIIISKYLR